MLGEAGVLMHSRWWLLVRNVLELDSHHTILLQSNVHLQKLEQCAWKKYAGGREKIWLWRWSVCWDWNAELLEVVLIHTTKIWPGAKSDIHWFGVTCRCLFDNYWYWSASLAMEDGHSLADWLLYNVSYQYDRLSSQLKHRMWGLDHERRTDGFRMMMDDI